MVSIDYKKESTQLNNNSTQTHLKLMIVIRLPLPLLFCCLPPHHIPHILTLYSSPHTDFAGNRKCHADPRGRTDCRC